MMAWFREGGGVEVRLRMIILSKKIYTRLSAITLRILIPGDTFVVYSQARNSFGSEGVAQMSLHKVK